MGKSPVLKIPFMEFSVGAGNPWEVGNKKEINLFPPLLLLFFFPSVILYRVRKKKIVYDSFLFKLLSPWHTPWIDKYKVVRCTKGRIKMQSGVLTLFLCYFIPAAIFWKAEIVQRSICVYIFKGHDYSVNLKKLVTLLKIEGVLE